jgi:hypothetical protein
LFFLNMEAQPSNEELPHLILPKFTYKPPNGLAQRPPIITRQLTLKTTFSTKWPPRAAPIAEHPRAQRREGGQVPVPRSLRGSL